MARQTTTAARQAEDPTEFADIVARSMPATIDADMVLTGMAKRALDKGMLTATSFDEALMMVFKEGIRLGREGTTRGPGRPRGARNAANGAAGEAGMSAQQTGVNNAPIGSGGSALGSARGE